MTSWNEAAAAAPDLAERVAARFAAHRHCTLATLRADGSPRTSGTETRFRAGQLELGSMGGARKARDLQRDPRMALHSTMADETMAGGDARISGRAVEITDPAELAAFSGAEAEMPPGPFHLFRIDVTELVLVEVDGDHLVIRSWTPEGGERRTERQ